MLNDNKDKILSLIMESEDIIHRIKSLGYLELCDISLQNNTSSYIVESEMNGLLSTIVNNNCDNIKEAYEVYVSYTKAIMVYPINDEYDFDRSESYVKLLVDKYVGDIRPEYLYDYISKSKYILDDISKKGVYSSKQLADKFASKDEINRIKAQLVRNSKNFIDSSLGDALNSIETIKVTNKYVDSVILPYVKDIPSIQKNISTNVEKTLSAIMDTHKSIVNIIAATDAMAKDSSVDPKVVVKMKKATNKIISGYLQLLSHVILMMLYKMLYHDCMMFAVRDISDISNSSIVSESYVDNINNLNDDYISSMIMSNDMKFFESTVNSIFESHISIDDPEINKLIVDRELNLLIPHIDAVINKYNALYKPKESKSITSMNIDLLHFKDDYIKVKNVGKSLAKKIEGFVDLLSTREYTIEEAMERVKLNESVVGEYSPYIENLRSCESYNSPEVQSDRDRLECTILMEFKKIGILIPQITSTLDDVNKSVMTALNIFANVLDGAVLIEITEIFQNMKNELDKVISSIGKAIVERIGTLEQYLIVDTDDMNIDIAPVVTETDNYYEYAVELFRHADKYDNEELIAGIYNTYNAFKLQTESALRVIYEAEGVSDDDKFSLIDWIKALLTKWRVKINKIVSNYNPWVLENKDALMALSADNLSVTVLPFFKISNDKILSTITSDINTTVGNVRSINKDQLHTYTSEALRNKMFGHIPLNTIKFSDPNLPLPTKLRHYYSYGTNQATKVKISGSALKKEIGYMISFCENYHKNVTSLENSFKSITNSIDAKSKELKNNEQRKEVKATTATPVVKSTAASDTSTSTKPAEPVVGESASMVELFSSLFIEAEVEKKGTPKVVSKGVSGTVSAGTGTALPAKRVIREIERNTTILVTAIMTAYEARYYEYLSALKGLMNASKGTGE